MSVPAQPSSSPPWPRASLALVALGVAVATLAIRWLYAYGLGLLD